VFGGVVQKMKITPTLAFGLLMFLCSASINELLEVKGVGIDFCQANACDQGNSDYCQALSQTEIWKDSTCFCCLPECVCAGNAIPVPNALAGSNSIFSYCNLKSPQCRSAHGRYVRETWLYCGREIECTEASTDKDSVQSRSTDKDSVQSRSTDKDSVQSRLAHDKDSVQSRLAHALKRTESKIAHRLSQLQQLKLRETKIGHQLSQLHRFNKAMKKQGHI